ncbi:MAG TPA: tetratricopeptide repeat protein [Saprospiraceae bacterium]|nr:tetratricopeptide repeat protein [Saprospiraceae bacterium]HMQ83509.1 tetratricopeptide repeat protein [Saprospiraceae bacterium]
MSDLEQDLQIEAFLNGDLSEEEQVLLIKQMAQNSVLAERIAIHRIQRLMKAQMLDDYIEEKLAEWQQQNENPQTSNKFTPKGWKNKPFLFATGALLFFFILFAILKTIPPAPPTVPPSSPQPPPTDVESPSPANTPPSNEKPIAEQPKKSTIPQSDAPSNIQRLALVDQFAIKNAQPGGTYLLEQRNTEAQSLFSDALKAQINQDNQSAIGLYEQLKKIKDNTLIFHINYNLGQLYFAEKKYQKAIECFSMVSENKNYDYQNEAQWMLAISYLANNQIDVCKNTLQEIISNSWHLYNEEQQASKLLFLLNGK